MACAIARKTAEGGVLVVEAGTGIGKTFAWLVPALLSGERMLISTATKTPQDQLAGRDLPRVAKSLGLPLRTAVLKGRTSYLCLRRLAHARPDAHAPGMRDAGELAQIERWAADTRSGDLAELPDLHEQSPWLPLVTSTRDNCLGAKCPQFRACHVNLARREAMAADVVIVNHHLFFADLVVRESGMAELLPTVRVLVFDEAHQLNEMGVQFLGVQLSTGQLKEVARDMLSTGWRLARGMADWQGLADGLLAAARLLQGCADRCTAMSCRLPWEMASQDEFGFKEALDLLVRVSNEPLAALDSLAMLSPEFPRLRERLLEISRRAEGFRSTSPEPGSVRWVEVGGAVRLVQAPLDIATPVQSRLLAAPSESPGGRTLIFTSATLGAEASLRWFTEPCGLTEASVLRVRSPFDYPSQAAIFVPTDLPPPNDPNHSVEVAQLAADSARQLGGRTMVLTTSLRALRAIGANLIETFEGTDIAVLVQGAQPKRVLLERFRVAAGEGKFGYILVASASFWKGVDLPGDALQLVILDKLPFPSPGDPGVQARSQPLVEQGRNPFTNYFLPEASIALQQGAGRLIRRERDCGILVICDARLANKGYGRRILSTLPPMPRLNDLAAYHEALEALTRASTKVARAA